MFTVTINNATNGVMIDPSANSVNVTIGKDRVL